MCSYHSGYHASDSIPWSLIEGNFIDDCLLRTKWLWSLNEIIHWFQWTLDTYLPLSVKKQFTSGVLEWNRVYYYLATMCVKSFIWITRIRRITSNKFEINWNSHSPHTVYMRSRNKRIVTILWNSTIECKHTWNDVYTLHIFVNI